MAPSKTTRQRPAKARAKRPSDNRKTSGFVDYETLARFRYELRKFQAFSTTAADKAGLTPQQHQALLIVQGFSDRSPVSIGDLAEYLLIRHHTAVELTDRMMKLGLLDRIADQTDGRRVVLELTREGERRLRKLSRIHLDELRAIGPTLSRLLRPFRRP